MNRLPPHSIEAEQGVLGCILLSPNDALAECLLKVNAPEVFYVLRHQTLFASLLAMYERREQVDIITLHQQLRDRGLLEKVGGLPYLNLLQDAVPSAANLPYYLDVVVEKFLIRKAVQVCTKAVQSAYEWQDNAHTLLDNIERDILAIRANRPQQDQPTVKELVNAAINEIEVKFHSGGALTGLATGFVDLDKFTDGLHPGEMTVIAAYPSVGKTALAMNIAEHVVLNLKVPVGVFSMEMTSVSLVKRCMCSVARVNLRHLSGLCLQSDFPKLTVAAGKLAHSCLYFDDTSGLSITALRARARRMWQQFGIKLFVVDYLQLMNAAGGSRKVENRQQEVADISNGIKCMAKEFNVPVLVLSQLNDDGKLRESRAIGQDADGIWLLKEKDSQHTLYINKQRNGPRNVVVPLVFRAEYTRFESAAKISDSDVPTPYADP